MNDIEKEIFRIGTIASGFDIAFRALLSRYATELGDRAPKEIAEIRSSFVQQVKNFTPSPNVPDDVYQSSIAELIRMLEIAFDGAIKKS